MKKYNFHTIRSYLLVFGLLSLSFTLVFGSLLFKTKLHPDYPLVFSDSNNKLMFITKSNNSKNDIASITNANISYANNDTRYLLYTNNNSLYLLDTTIGGVGERISLSVLSYGFSLDDKYVYYIDNNNTLHIYDRINRENIKIANNVKKLELMKDNILIYNQNDNLVFQKVNDTPVLISDTYETVELNNENKLILYSVKDGDYLNYFVYDIQSNNFEKVLDNIYKLYDKDSSYTKFVYTVKSTINKDATNVLKDQFEHSDKKFVSYSYEDYTSKKVTKAVYEANQREQKQIDYRNQIRIALKEYGIIGYDLYFKNNNITNLVASNINDLYYYDYKNQIYSYSAYNFENNELNIDDYDDEYNLEKFKNDLEALKLNTLFLKYGNQDAVMAYKNITSPAKVYLRNNSEYYLLIEKDSYYNLYYSKINNRTIKLVGEVDTKLISNKLNKDYAYGYLFINYINDKYYLNVITDGRVKTIAEDINKDYYVVSENKETIYYLKTKGDYNNDLNVYNGIRTSRLASDLYSFMYINNDLIYVTKNYDDVTKTSDLYRIDGNRLTLIYKDINDWYSPLIDNEEED